VRLNGSLRVGLILLMTQLTVGCEKLGIGDPPPVADDGAPDAQQLKKISYMTADNTGVKGRKVYKRLEEAKSCKDLELALRWNRPPNVAGGPFKQKLVYLNQQLPADLPKNTEMFVAARIERGAMLPGGGAGWLLRMKDGSLIQAVESTDYWEKQEVDSQQGQPAAIVKPTKPGRVFCGHGVYQGPLAKAPDQNGNIPLVSMLFSMDRDK
jgi:hypothetical protein